MINNIRMRVRKRKLELNKAKVDNYTRHVNTSLITEYSENADNYSKRKQYLTFFWVYFFIFVLL